MSVFEIVPAAELPLADQALVANQAFAGYVGGWNDLDANSLARFLVAQGADLAYSRFLRSAGELVGFGYLNRTGNILRLTGMGIIPNARGTGAAGQLLANFFEEASSRGDGAMMLEVIEQNQRAHALYRREGFQEVGRLFGWRRLPGPSSTPEGGELEEISIIEALRFPGFLEYPEIPWQISRHALAKAAKTRAFRSGESCLVIGDPETPPIRFHSLTNSARDWGALRRLLAAVLDRFSDREFLGVAIWPEDYGSQLFEPLGFSREPLNQFLMRKDC